MRYGITSNCIHFFKTENAFSLNSLTIIFRNVLFLIVYFQNMNRWSWIDVVNAYVTCVKGGLDCQAR